MKQFLIRLGQVLAGLGVCLAILFGVAISCNLFSETPDNAQVVIEDDAKTYHSPTHCFYEGKISDQKNLRVITFKQAREFGYKVDYRCEDDFKDETTLFAVLLDKAGITHHKP
jgi:hypothetical protein